APEIAQGDGVIAPHKPLTEAEQSEKDKQIAQLKQELAATKEYLQSIIETQEATNEELQSANEELHTVNEEMQHRNELLTQLNNDLTNLVNSVNLPMVMVGADLSVRRFTPQATAILGLMASDVGRPISRLKLKVDVANLEQMMLDVIQKVQPKQSRVQDNDGNWCSLRITPYRTLDNRIDGVVLSVVDRSAFQEESGSPEAQEGRKQGKTGSSLEKSRPKKK